MNTKIKQEEKYYFLPSANKLEKLLRSIIQKKKYYRQHLLE